MTAKRARVGAAGAKAPTVTTELQEAAAVKKAVRDALENLMIIQCIDVVLVCLVDRNFNNKGKECNATKTDE